ncbi:hypothetical protein, partial [Endozoicomonas sp. SESOKO1]|uniref:hypothetical protein n=1 Tax=Endozoicomonas sp. SESOKO1 TaxID=2828742 RepID=UPI0021478B72
YLAGQSRMAMLELARFKERCCLSGLALYGQQVTPDAVVQGFPDSPEGNLGVTRFKELCCLRGLPLNGRQVTPEVVVKEYQAVNATLEIARFKQECCLRGVVLNGQQVTPDEVVKDYQAAKATLEIARFKAECCLRGLLLNGRRVTPDAVVRAFPDRTEGKLGIARFKEQCCLRGLLLKGQQVTPDAVVSDYRAARATLELVRFKEQCCLKGLMLNGRQVTTDEVVRGFQALNATLELVRFKAECSLRGLLLNGQQVTPEAVVRDFPNTLEGKLGIARFKAECCLRGLAMNGQQVRPDAVVQSYPDSPEGKLGIARFKEQCCLRGLLLNGQQVTPESVVKGYQRGGWLLERAIFYSQLALNARELSSVCLDRHQVLAAFDEGRGDHSSKQARYLIQQLQQSQGDDSEAQDVLQEARQILEKVSVRDDEQDRLQCILTFMAMQHGLTIDDQGVSAEQVLRSIKTLRHSFQNDRIHFFFLAHCYITGRSVDGQEIRKDQVLDCLQRFPEGSRLRHALGTWFEQYSSEANIQTKPKVPQLNALTLETLEIIQGINDSYHSPPILITGSYARYLQNRCSSFNDIDLICTTEGVARTLFGKLHALATGTDPEIPKSLTIWQVQGCPAIRLAKAYNIHLSDGDLGTRVLGLQVSIDGRVTDADGTRLAVHVPGVARPVWCLSFAEETRLLNDTLEYLVDNLDPLTGQLQHGEAFYIPRTLLFNAPRNRDERIYGLLMRCLLTLNKAVLFIALHSENRPDSSQPEAGQHNAEHHAKHHTEEQRLHTLAALLHTKLHRHACCHDFVRSLIDWLSRDHPVNNDGIERKELVNTLLAILHYQ